MCLGSVGGCERAALVMLELEGGNCCWEQEHREHVFGSCVDVAV